MGKHLDSFAVRLYVLAAIIEEFETINIKANASFYSNEARLNKREGFK